MRTYCAHLTVAEVDATRSRSCDGSGDPSHRKCHRNGWGSVLNLAAGRADDANMADDCTSLHPGMVLVSPCGDVRIIRSRTGDDTGWNCSDGPAIADDEANDPRQWCAYRPDELVAELELARQLGRIAGQRALSGGLATWDACSGRPCVLPRLARLAR